MKKLVIVIMATLLLVACEGESSSSATIKGVKILDKHPGGRSTFNYVTIETENSKYKLQIDTQDLNFIETGSVVDIMYDIGSKKILKISIPSKGGMRNND